MAAIGILDELRFAQAGFALREKLMNLRRTVYEDVRQPSEVEPDDISILLGERLQELEYVGLTELIIQSAQLFALGPGWWRHRQWSAPSSMGVS
jgi:hypothetical protein